MWVPGFISGREKLWAYTVATLVVLICWGVIFLEGGRIRSFDETAFIAIADSLATHGRYADENGELTAYRAPGLIFFLAPLVKMGAGVVGLRLANALLVGLSLVVLFHFIRRISTPLAGLIAVALVPTWPVVIYASSTLYPQTLAALVLIITVNFLERLAHGPFPMVAALAGLSFGYLVLTIPVALLLLPVFLGWIVIHSRHRWMQSLVFCAVSLSLVGAWSMRNHMAFDTFIPVSTSAGYNLLVGNTPEARHDTSTEIRFPEYVYADLTGADEVAANRIMTRAAIREIRNDPLRAGTRYAGKFAHWFHFTNDLVSDKVIDGGASGVGIGTREMVLLISYGGMILPLVVHVALRRQFPFSPVELLFLCLWVGAGLAYAVFFTRVRFRLPFDWLIIAGNGMFLAALAERYMKHGRKNPRHG